MNKGLWCNAHADGKIIGVLTGKPLHTFQEAVDAFNEAGFNPLEYYYCGELMIAAAFQNKNIEKQLVEYLQQEVAQWGYKKFCCMVVEDNKDHQLRPIDFQFDEQIMIEQLGFVPMPVTISLSWSTLNDNGIIQEQNNKLLFWHLF